MSELAKFFADLNSKPTISDAERAGVEEWAFRTLALAHPHEAYQMDPERFWQLFQTERPGVSKEQMLAILEMTNPTNPRPTRNLADK